MSDSAGENDVYKVLSADMRNGLKQIYRQIASASASAEDNAAAARSEALFSEASDQLQEVVKATESAAMNIMDIVEKQLEGTEENARLIESLSGSADPEIVEKLRQRNESLMADLTDVLTALSFQDITGQRIKKVLSALVAIENSVVELYLSSGLVMDAAEKNPDKTVNSIKEEAEKAVKEYTERAANPTLQGPANKPVSQAAIDDMLAQLGM